MLLQPGDIVFTRGTGILSRLIRFFSTTGGESRTMVNHVAVVTHGGTAGGALIVEALTTVQYNRLWRYATPKNEIAIFRARNLSIQEANLVARTAMTYVGRTYGYLKIVTHFLDYFLGGRYVFRHLTVSDRYPICSWVVAHAYDAVGKRFGVSDNAASPDDMWDYCVTHPDKYTCVMPLGQLGLPKTSLADIFPPMSEGLRNLKGYS